tara:strand:+ start:74 stop:478 length:405 start_codon:yes stop_codon:yes gene_type:complete
MKQFNKILAQHTESQYLDLETNYLNLYNFTESLLSITENKDIDSDSQRLTHFNALTIRLNEGLNRFQKFTKDLRGSLFTRNSANSNPEGNNYEVRILATKREKKLIIESLEHLARSFPDMVASAELQKIADNIK